VRVVVWSGLVMLAFGAGALHHDFWSAHFLIGAGAGLVTWAVGIRRDGKA
jgi:hypothetical protein